MLMKTDLFELLEIAKHAAGLAAAVHRRAMDSDKLKFDTKSSTCDLVNDLVVLTRSANGLHKHALSLAINLRAVVRRWTFAVSLQGLLMASMNAGWVHGISQPALRLRKQPARRLSCLVPRSYPIPF